MRSPKVISKTNINFTAPQVDAGIIITQKKKVKIPRSSYKQSTLTDALTQPDEVIDVVTPFKVSL